MPPSAKSPGRDDFLFKSGQPPTGPVTASQGLDTGRQSVAAASRNLNDPKMQEKVIRALPKLHRKQGRHMSAAFMEYWLTGKNDPRWFALTELTAVPYDDNTLSEGENLAELKVAARYVVLTRQAVTRVLSFSRAKEALQALKESLKNLTAWPPPRPEDACGEMSRKHKEAHEAIRALTPDKPKFGDFSRIHEPQHYVMTRTVNFSPSVLSSPDDLDGSLGRFSFRAYARGKVVHDGEKRYAENVEYGIRIYDNFEFSNEIDLSFEVKCHKMAFTINGQSTVTQPLGLWSYEDGYVPLGQAHRADAFLTNAAVRRLRTLSNDAVYGHDFCCVSEVESIAIDPRRRILLTSLD